MKNDDWLDAIGLGNWPTMRDACVLVLFDGGAPAVKRGYFTECQAWANNLRDGNPFLNAYILNSEGHWMLGSWSYGVKKYLWELRATAAIPKEVLMAEVLTQ